MDSILDWVPKMVERTPGVLIAVLGVYQVVLMDDKLGMTKEFIGESRTINCFEIVGRLKPYP